MRTLAIYGRELAQYFTAPAGYVVAFLFLLANGIAFGRYLQLMRGQVELLLEAFFGAEIFWFLIMLVPPLLTMRSIADERRQGTFELLTTSGIRESSIVVGKFAAAWTFNLTLWLATLPLFFLLADMAPLDWGVLIAVGLGIALISGLYCAVGILASATTDNPLVAAIFAIVLNLLVMFANTTRHLLDPGQMGRFYLEFLSPVHHFTHDYLEGVFDLRYVGLYGSLTIAVLFTAVKVLERRRWW